VIHESLPCMCHRDDVFEVDSHAPRQVQIGECPQSDQTPDHGPPMRLKEDVDHAHDLATPVPAAVIPPNFLYAGNAFLYREEDPPPTLHGQVSQSPQHRRITRYDS